MLIHFSTFPIVIN